jgi:hypothetical protein
MAAPRTAIAAAIPTITATTTADPLTTAGNCFPGLRTRRAFRRGAARCI